MDGKVTLAKMTRVIQGEVVVMSDAELEWLIDSELLPLDVVSLPNPQQVGTLDTRIVAKRTHPQMLAERQKQELLTSASRAPNQAPADAWDEPKGASSPRGWYWPKGTTRHGETSCAGHYLDYGPDHYRHDANEAAEPGHIHCVVVEKETGRAYAARYVETPAAARQWIEQEAAKAGHRA